GKPLPEPFNAEDAYHYGGATITVDNKHIYMTICVPTRNKSGKTYNNCDIYSTDYVYGFNEKTGANEWHWTPLENMGPNINTESGWEAQPSVTADGRFLYFASARLESKAIDIYYSEKKNGVWGEAVNVGPPINTERNDKTPFIHSDSRTLYFSSDGHLGFGKYDVFFARQGDDGQWEKPKNLGHPINTAEDEHGFVVSTNGSRVYFSSDKLKDQRGGKLDLFYFNLYKEARPDSVVVLKGAITNEDNQPLSKAVVEVKNMKTKAIQKIAVDSMDGKFAAVVRLKKGEDMVMNVKAKDRAFSSQLITAKDEKGTPKTTRKVDVKLETLKVGKSYKLNDIYYATNSAELSQKSTLILDEFSQYLRENPSLKIEIHGHTDNVGNDQSNLVLSTERAFSVLDYLQQQGVSKDQIVKWRGFGETRPVASNDHPLG
ncbi:MAG: OmpA family protein, partial [Bacteroidota bacterium]